MKADLHFGGLSLVVETVLPGGEILVTRAE